MKMKLHETKNDLRAKTRRAMIDLLNQELADVLDLGLQAKQAHWNVKVRTSSACTNCSTKSPRSWKSLPTIWPNAQWNWEVWRWARFKSFQRNRGFPAIHWTWPPDRNTSLHYPARWQIVARALDAQLIPQAKRVMLTRRICSRRFRVALTSCSGSSKRTRKQSTEPLEQHRVTKSARRRGSFVLLAQTRIDNTERGIPEAEP